MVAFRPIKRSPACPRAPPPAARGGGTPSRARARARASMGGMRGRCLSSAGSATRPGAGATRIEGRAWLAECRSRWDGAMSAWCPSGYWILTISTIVVRCAHTSCPDSLVTREGTSNVLEANSLAQYKTIFLCQMG
jgi:hypothetical protein